MNVLPTDDQLQLRASARAFLRRECPMKLVREVMSSERGFSEPLWKRMAELGWLGLSIGSEHGGAGMDLVSMAILLEELGQVLAPGPFLSTALIGASAIELGGDAGQKQAWLPSIASGDLRIAFAHAEADGTTEAQLFAEPTDDGLILRGRNLFVPDAQIATRLLVAAEIEVGPGELGVAVALVDVDTPGITIRPIEYNDPTRKVCEISFDRARVPSDAVLHGGGGGRLLLSKLLDVARVGICAEMAGAAQRVLDLSLEYAKTREQFGQPIGRFQAIQHRCADMLIRTEGIRSSAYYAAWSVANDAADASSAPLLAKAFCSDAFPAVAGDGIQIHGGLGFTWEQDLHLYYKRAKASQTLYGSASRCRELAASILIDSQEG